MCLRAIDPPLEKAQRLWHFASLGARLSRPLPSSVVVTGSIGVFGTGAVAFGTNTLLYPSLHLESQGAAEITLGDGVVLSRGVHLVAMTGITIGKGVMIGEYSSIRDANHRRQAGLPIRNAGYIAKPIVIGDEVWIGRGAIVLGGVTIGEGATIGANAVVTRDVAAGDTVVGVPARSMHPSRDTVRL